MKNWIFEYVSGIDLLINQFVYNNPIPWLVKTSAVISVWGGNSVLITLGIIIFFAYLLKGHWSNAAIIIFSVWSTAHIVILSKDFFSRLRPENAFEIIGNGSMPSGHAAIAAAFFAACLYVFGTHLKSLRLRILLGVLCVVAIIAIGLSRVVLNVHWISDVLAGWVLGAILVIITVMLVKRIEFILVKKRSTTHLF